MEINDLEKWAGKPLQLTVEDYEELKALWESRAWRKYRQVLLYSKESYVNSLLPMKEGNELLKNVGIVAGINFVINQLPALIAQYEYKKERDTKKAQKE